MVWVPIPDPSRVRVASALAGLHQLTDLPRLIASLGHQPSFEEAPPGTALNEGRVALIGEVRVFYFQNYELRFGAENGSEILNELLPVWRLFASIQFL